MRKTVIFDLDGTLLNTLPDLTYGVNEALKKFGQPERTTEEVCQAIGNGVGKLIEKSITGGKDNPNYQAILDYDKQVYINHCTNDTYPYQGIVELLVSLKKDGYKLAVLSNKQEEAVVKIINHYFPGLFIIAQGENKMFNRKPDPASVLYLIEQLGSDINDTIYVGDSDVDVKTAINANIECIAVDYGFRSREVLLEAGAKNIASNSKMLEELIRCH